MDKQRAIELLKQKSKEAIIVASLPYENNEFLPWRRNIEDILESAFGVTSTEYKRVVGIPGKTLKGTREEIKRGYKRHVHTIQQEVNSIIQKYEILELEAKPSSISKPKDTAELPIYLFDNMQLHPKIIKSSEALFKDRHYASAILEAFKAVNNFVKEKSGLSSDERRGMSDKQLMAKVFDERAPLIKLNELSTDTDISEQEGFKFLFMGATAGIRNPKAHDNIIQTDPFITLEYLGFASFLLKRIEGWRVNQQ